MMMIVIPQEAHVLLAYKKGKVLCPFFFHHRILVEAAHVKKFYLSIWVHFKRILLCLSTRIRGRELRLKLIHQVM